MKTKFIVIMAIASVVIPSSSSQSISSVCPQKTLTDDVIKSIRDHCLKGQRNEGRGNGARVGTCCDDLVRNLKCDENTACVVPRTPSDAQQMCLTEIKSYTDLESCCNRKCDGL
uniref:Uncharacterized protein n=1 Tax=Peronospora matthiolae TaxID=2874970 RepID=A0AAV1TMN8_9STRA